MKDTKITTIAIGSLCICVGFFLIPTMGLVHTSIEDSLERQDAVAIAKDIKNVNAVQLTYQDQGNEKIHLYYKYPYQSELHMEIVSPGVLDKIKDILNEDATWKELKLGKKGIISKS